MKRRSAQRGWTTNDTYLPVIKIGEVMRAFAVSEVIASRDARFRPGELVQGLFGWRDDAVARDDGPDPFLPVSATGMTAYFGLLDVGKAKPGESVVVSATAGATGSAVGQFAKIHGCRVIGIASDEENTGENRGKQLLEIAERGV